MESVLFFFKAWGVSLCAVAVTVILTLVATYRGRVILSFIRRGKSKDEITIENLQRELKYSQAISDQCARQIESAAKMQRHYTDRVREIEQNRLTLDELETLLSFCDPEIYKHRVPVDGLMRKLLKLRNGA